MSDDEREEKELDLSSAELNIENVRFSEHEFVMKGVGENGVGVWGFSELTMGESA
ncbi:hypothetical protein JHK86_051001 [Glycine max]|nr:hypothetical protein JHK86_051001 [Glycine max]